MTEEAKAVSEIAKTTGKVVDAGQQFGGWFAKVFGRPLETASDIFNDQLQFRRLKNGVGIFQKTQKILQELKVEERRELPPKLLVPLLKNITLEEDETLQEMWAELLAKALNPNETRTTRVAYLDVLSQLEPQDSRILKHVFDAYCTEVQKNVNDRKQTSIEYGFETKGLIEDLKILPGDAHRALDNLIRLRLIKSFSSATNAVLAGFDGPPPSHDYGYHAVCITEFGLEFVVLCTNKAR